MVSVEFDYEYEIEDNIITLGVSNCRRGGPMIFDNHNINIAMYIEKSNPKLYSKIENELYEREEAAEEERRYEGGRFDEDAWKGYD